jgi:hypothetical protein
LEGWEGRTAFRPPPDVIDNVILQTLNKIPFVSMQKLEKSICISTAIV